MRRPESTRIPLSVRVMFIAYFLSAFAVVGQVTIVGKQVYDMTGRELDLGLLGLAEFLPVALLVPIAGTVADRIDRRWVFGGALVAEALASLMLFAYARSEPTSVVPIFWIIGFVGIARSFASPAGRALIIDLSPVAVVARVVALKSVAFQIGIITGPVAFGFLFVVDEPLPYLAGTAALMTAFGIAVLTPSSGARRLDAPGPGRVVHDALEGLRFIRRSPILFGSMGLDLFAVLFGGAVALLPAIAEDRLGVGAVGLGWLRAAVGIGAGAVALAMTVRPVQRNLGRVLFTVVTVFGLGTVVLGFSSNYALAFVALLVLSGADAVSMFIRLTLVPLAAPEEMRGRVLAVENVFIGASNELGAAESGLTAAVMGLVGAVVFGGVCTVVVVAFWWRWFPDLRDLDTFEEVIPTTRE
ncbi:MAG: MFS transporter [Acidimicrobiales bacterium]|nr:MFS transporter [Acidimicrobiales bacterium]|tara:strand:+ start:1630 stop:2871 length:1242 start_codon:yes stop_codon:yes gene_type:complete